MSQKPDDLEALKTICNTLEPFNEVDRERIVRWATERLGIKNIAPTQSQFVQPLTAFQTTPALGQSENKDIKTFLLEKNPTSANQLVAAVAYYYKFEAPVSERKNAITKDDLLDACRKATLERPKAPNVVMVNAAKFGLVDNVGTGTYEINSVGENLVAVSMPSVGHGTSGKKRTKKNSKKK